ncbi:MAG: hypothetical protein PHF95_02860, partial [bacterium]|nr:hypothetical protein [bacterium]
MAEIITEKDFPLQKSWFGKKIISGVSYLIYIVIPIGLPFYGTFKRQRPKVYRTNAYGDKNYSNYDDSFYCKSSIFR